MGRLQRVLKDAHLSFFFFFKPYTPSLPMGIKGTAEGHPGSLLTIRLHYASIIIKTLTYGGQYITNITNMNAHTQERLPEVNTNLHY